MRLSTTNNSFKKNKIYTKQSYVLLIWIRYLISTDINKHNIVTTKTSKKPSFFVYPFRNYKTTVIKSPMAHKTFSQEQYLIRNYFLSISFYTYNESSIYNLNNSLFYVKSLKKVIPNFSTNMLFLKKYSVNLKFKDDCFFSYYKF